jgi:hypothetical protein
MSPEETPQNGREASEGEYILGSPADPNSASERFYAGAVRRIQIAIMAFGAAAAIFASIRFGSRETLGLVLGTGLSYWNFRSLVSAVTGLAGRIVDQHEPASGGSIVFRFIVRIPLVALAGYAIFISSPGSLRGFLAGLCVPVAGILWETGYEAVVAIRRGF